MGLLIARSGPGKEKFDFDQKKPGVIIQKRLSNLSLQKTLWRKVSFDLFSSPFN